MKTRFERLFWGFMLLLATLFAMPATADVPPEKYEPPKIELCSIAYAKSHIAEVSEGSNGGIGLSYGPAVYDSPKIQKHPLAPYAPRSNL